MAALPLWPALLFLALLTGAGLRHLFLFSPSWPSLAPPSSSSSAPGEALGAARLGSKREVGRVPLVLSDEFASLSAQASARNVSLDPAGRTDVADRLNGMMARNPGKVYTGGKGVLVRNILDGMTDDTNYLVVPATFWVDDIFAISQFYPTGNPMMPSWMGRTDSWYLPVVGVVIGSDMSSFFYDFQNIQADNWGYGVFYPTDSNSVDQRCRWLQDLGGWECPGGWIKTDGAFSGDASKIGAGRYPPGSPVVEGDKGGGGAGCHFDHKTNAINQINGKKGTDWNLVADNHCQCNYKFAHNFPADAAHSDVTTQNGWDGWVEDFVNYGLAGRKGPTWQMDLASCWVNNPRDMINMQNRIYWQRAQWLDGSVPWFNTQGSVQDRSDSRRYWGWNEVPIDSNLAKDPQRWDAVIMVLPAWLCGGVVGSEDIASCMQADQRGSLESQLDQHVARGALRVGVGAIRDRPGSYVLFARQVEDGAGNWRREFFCQSLKLSKYQIIYAPPNGQVPQGACYIEHA